MFFRWWRMDAESRQRVWWLYGRFCGLMCCGSCIGAAAWGAWMQNLVLLYTVNNPQSTLTVVQFNLLSAQVNLWLVAFFIMYALEFFCLSVAKLMVLDRMKEFAVSEADGTARRWVVGGRMVMAAVVVGNTVGLCGNVAAAVYNQEAADLTNAAAAAYAANTTNAYNNLNIQLQQKTQLAESTQSIQQFCEVAVLLLIIVAFAVFGIACARLLGAALRDMNDAAGAAGRKVRRQILGTCAFVFVTFLLRAVYSTMYALANLLQNNSSVDTCPSSNFCDIDCYNSYDLMQYWLLYTPEFQLIISFISSPLAMLVALWGMTSDRAMQLMQSPNRQELRVTQDGTFRFTATQESLLRGAASQDSSFRQQK